MAIWTNEITRKHGKKTCCRYEFTIITIKCISTRIVEVDIENGTNRLKEDKKLITNRIKMMTETNMKEAILQEIEEYNTEQLEKKTIKETTKQRAENEFNLNLDRMAESIRVVKKGLKLLLLKYNKNLADALLIVMHEQELIHLRIVESKAKGRAMEFGTAKTSDFERM